MRTVIGRFTPQVFAIMRIVVGATFACHGTQKILNWPPRDFPVKIASLPGAAGIIELVCGVLIVIGLFTGLAAFIASGEMAAAYFLVHFPKGWVPLQNKGELAVVYCFVFLYIAAHGAGIWSVDSRLKGTRR